MAQDSHHWSPDWSALWRFGACWAGRPVGGLILPGSERLRVMTEVMDQFMLAYPRLPGQLQTYAIIQNTAVRLALTTARDARTAARQPDLWHDATHTGSTPLVDLADLQQHQGSGLWLDLMNHLKPRALGLARAQGVDATDAEDIIAEATAGLVKPRKDGTAVLHDLLVYEQLPPLFLSIVRRRIVNHIRHRNASRRAVTSTLSLHTDDNAAYDLTERSAFAAWAAEEADPFGGMTLARLAEECGDALSGLQQHILSVLYMEESATYMEVANSAWFAQAVNLKPNTSEATRRRALDAQHDSALDHLARALGIHRQKS